MSKQTAATDELVDKMQREAYLKMVRKYQEEAEKELRKKEEERRRKQERLRRYRRVLEAAFDGDTEAILNESSALVEQDKQDGIDASEPVGKAIIAKHQFELFECSDANDNTPLSEASSGGHEQLVSMLIARGADVNCRGQFGRTPLYRAAFAGHLSVCQVLLQNGADPRIYAHDGLRPEDATSLEAIKELLHNWDLSVTNSLLRNIEKAKLARRTEQTNRLRIEQDRIKKQITELSNTLKQFEAELEKLEDSLLDAQFALEEATKKEKSAEELETFNQRVHSAEFDIEVHKLKIEQQNSRISTLRSHLNEKAEEAEEVQLGQSRTLASSGVKLSLTEFSDFFVKSDGLIKFFYKFPKLKNDLNARWPIVIDPSDKANVLLRYADTNYINVLNVSDMQPSRIGVSFLGAVRYAKPFVLDLMEFGSLWEYVNEQFGKVHPQLMDKIIDRPAFFDDAWYRNELLKAPVFERAGSEYTPEKFNESLIQERFRIFIILRAYNPTKVLLDKFFPIWIMH